MTGNGAGHPGVCVVCGGGLKRNGTTSSGTPRWRCKDCGSSRVKKRPDLRRRAEFRSFLDWLEGSDRQDDIASSSTTFHRRHEWCWRVKPVIVPTGEIHDEIQLDGTYLADGWCLLSAITGRGKVIDYQWCDEEKKVAWEALLSRIPAPRVAIMDGGRGLLSAIKTCWPDTRIQRCLVHIQRNVRTHVTCRPRLDAAKALRALSLELTRIKDRETAAAWVVKLHGWHQIYGHMLDEKTHAGAGIIRPTWANANSPWWWTHGRLRKAYYLMENIVRTGVAFTYLDEAFDGLGISSTTNRIEGGCNHELKDILRRHRGMTSDHQRRACEWWLYLHSEAPKDPWSLVKPEHWNPTTRAAQTAVDEPDDPDHGLGYNAGTVSQEQGFDEGFGIRKGWGGRST